jgi:hypothetical protein
MASTILTDLKITRAALAILHQKLNFIGSINRQYDDSFAKEGAKIGSSLKIRMPNEYTVTSGKTLDVQDTVETNQTLTVATQKGIHTTFSSAELSLSLQDFSDRILEPSMTRLASAIEADVMTVALDVRNAVFGSTASYSDVLAGRVLMQRGLAPLNDRTANLTSQDMADIVDGNKALFNDQAQIGKQYKEGMMGRAAGYDFVENTLWPNFTTGADDGAYICNTSTGITSGTATITVTAGSGAIVVGDVFTVGGVFSVHPETKVSTGVLQQFVATAASAGGSVAISVSPTPVTSGATQNVTIVSAGASKAVTFAGTLSTAYTTSLLYQKDAFTFVTADLPLPQGVDMARRVMSDGISLRLVRDYDINNDMFPTRIECLYGFKTLRPDFATRLHYTV